MSNEAQVWREGIVAGLWGAAGVALWFLAVDLAAGTPLATPAMLGRALWSLTGGDAVFGMGVWVAAYTAVHVAVFIGIGLLLSVVVDVSRRIPGVLAGLLVLFVVFEVGFQLATLVLRAAPGYTGLAWYHIGAANLLAAVLMGRYVWRKHPELTPRFAQVLDGRI